MWKLLSVAASGLALGSIVLAPALAQQASDDQPTHGMMGGDCPMMHMMGHGMMRGGKMGMKHDPTRMAAMAEGRLAYLKAVLKITDSQNEAWTGYADAVKARVAAMQEAREKMVHGGNALERMDARISRMETMVAAMKEVKPATEKLYAQLTDDQKKIADQLIGAGCGAM